MSANPLQNTDAWRAARLGKLTASRLADALARTKSGWGASRANLMTELLLERLTGQGAERHVNDAMRFGMENEAYARAAYEFRTGASVAPVGFVDHPTIAMFGASPDGLIGADGLLEIKVPNSATHLETLLSGAIPARYAQQMLAQMACTGRAWCDYCSFDPRMPEHMRLFVRRIERDSDEIAALESAAAGFLGELDRKLVALMALQSADMGV